MSYKRHGSVDEEVGRLKAQLAAAIEEEGWPVGLRRLRGRRRAIWETKTRWRSTASRCRAEASTRTSGSVARRRPRRRKSYTGPRSDELLSTDEISGDYSAASYMLMGAVQ